jgi:hypothetical protein
MTPPRQTDSSSEVSGISFLVNLQTLTFITDRMIVRPNEHDPVIPSPRALLF